MILGFCHRDKELFLPRETVKISNLGPKQHCWRRNELES